MKKLVFPLCLVALFFLFSCEEEKYADWKILNEQWLQAHKSDSGFVCTQSGLCYKVIHQGYDRRPNPYSWVSVQYKGYLIDSTLFERGMYEYYLSNAIQGWIEGITKMNGGGTYIFYIPSSLAYGKDGSGQIPPYSTLIYEITLLSSTY
ncbi:MAG TPA: FKBP-type peptidyl-prolyl cis-trans isomerase [Paludibacteraceae bacterium]|nr:FKBP-type peptidyl-prolyl cis-trans isomerase [Paludibacteraceae bacterium]